MEIQHKEAHVHEVLEMMEVENGTYSRKSLCAAIEEKFGATTRFHSCSASGMDANDVVDFLDARGKFTGTADAFSFDTTRRCSH
jgi:probable metal-binding protein